MIHRVGANAAFAYGNANKPANAKSQETERSNADPFAQIARERIAEGEGTDRLVPDQPSARTEAPRSASASSDRPRGQQLFKADAQTVRVAADETGSLLNVTG